VNSDVTVTGFRDFMEWTGTTGRKSTTNVTLLLNAASDALERDTGRLITSSGSNTTRKFTSNGRAYLVIPDLRTATTVTIQSAALTADAGYWLIASRQSPDIFVGLQLRAFGQDSYLANPEWFDRNLDQTWYRYGGDTSLPNDVVVTGLWGWTFTPYQWVMGIYALAGYFYQHADALFSSARATPEGNIFDLSQLPTEVKMLQDWRIGEQAAIV
jgi:hypothetical protein